MIWVRRLIQMSNLISRTQFIFTNYVQWSEMLGSISAVSRVRSLILPVERRLDAWPVDLVCDIIGKLIIQASSMSLEVKPVSNFLIYLAQNCIKRSLTHPNDFRNSFFGTFPYIVKNILRYISVHGDMYLIFFDLRIFWILVVSSMGPNWLIPGSRPN